MKTIVTLSGILVLGTSIALAASNKVKTFSTAGQTCIASNATPNHSIGKFPNKGNPHSFKAQNVQFCFDATPTKGTSASFRANTVGVTLSGIPIRPGTADYYDANSPRGHSRDRSSGWNLEGMGSAETLGMDQNNAHVDNRGLYHYHAMPSALINLNGGTLMGYAADGFEIHYVGASAKPAYSLKTGTRPTAPFGKYDGTYEEDWEYNRKAGNLDKCNGASINGKYVYFATDSFPFFPRCHWGTVSRDFMGPG